MPEIIVRQLKHESDTWRRLLVFMSDENVHLKNRLAEILGSNRDTLAIAKAESFQSCFLQFDELIRFLRNEVAVFDALLVREIYEDGAIFDDLKEKLGLIRTQMCIAEMQFNKLKLEFNNDLLASTSAN